MRKILTAKRDIDGIIILGEKGSSTLHFALPKSINSINKAKAWLYRNGWHRSYDLEAIEFAFKSHEHSGCKLKEIYEKNKKQVKATNKETGKTFIFESIVKASDTLKISRTTVSMACRDLRHNKYYDFCYVS